MNSLWSACMAQVVFSDKSTKGLTLNLLVDSEYVIA